MKKQEFFRLAVSVMVCLGAGVVGSVFTADSIPTWYETLAKPDLNPPNWVFAPVWTSLYVLMGVSAYLVWKKGMDRKDVRTAMTLFSLQLAFNVFWSFIFFGLMAPKAAFLEIVMLWVLIALTMYRFYGISKNATYLLAPYILWVSFAAYLNYMIWQLN